MDAFDFAPETQKKKKRTDPRNIIFRLGTYYFLAGTLCLLGFFLYTFLNPYNQLNPYQPPMPQAELAISQPEVTPTVISIDPEALILPTNTPTPAFVTPPPGVLFFVPQEDTPTYLPHASGCTGTYVAGNITNLEGRPLINMTVRVTGMLGGVFLEEAVAISGSNLVYSASGWEIKLSDGMIESTGTLSVGVFATDSLHPLSDQVLINTYYDCKRNLVLVNFTQGEPQE